MKKMTLAFDFRTKLLATIVIATVCISGSIQNKFPIVSLVVMLVPFLLLLSIGKWWFFLKNSVILLVLWAISTQGVSYLSHAVGLLLLILSGIFVRLLPGAVMGYYTFSTTTMSHLVASLHRMHLTDVLIIPISVMFRFFATIKCDYRQIREAMMMHDLTLRTLWKTPERLLEYRMVPLLMCVLKSADDVAISAMTRGMVVGQKRSSLEMARLKCQDYLAIAACVGLIILACYCSIVS